jgi:hypothetical protein
LISEYDNYQKIYRDDIRIISMNAEDITDAHDFEDGELASVLG